jgi:hypothetical protein
MLVVIKASQHSEFRSNFVWGFCLDDNRPTEERTGYANNQAYSNGQLESLRGKGLPDLPSVNEVKSRSLLGPLIYARYISYLLFCGQVRIVFTSSATIWGNLISNNYWRTGMGILASTADERVKDVKVTEESLSVDIMDVRTHE